MSLESDFDAALAASKNLAERPDNMTMLAMYALYKQASAGDIAGDRPGFTDMVGRAKFDAWSAHNGMSKDQAMQQYIALVDTLRD